MSFLLFGRIYLVVLLPTLRPHCVLFLGRTNKHKKTRFVIIVSLDRIDFNSHNKPADEGPSSKRAGGYFSLTGRVEYFTRRRLWINLFSPVSVGIKWFQIHIGLITKHWLFNWLGSPEAVRDTDFLVGELWRQRNRRFLVASRSGWNGYSLNFRHGGVSAVVIVSSQSSRWFAASSLASSGECRRRHDSRQGEASRISGEVARKSTPNPRNAETTCEHQGKGPSNTCTSCWAKFIITALYGGPMNFHLVFTWISPQPVCSNSFDSVHLCSFLILYSSKLWTFPNERVLSLR